MRLSTLDVVSVVMDRAARPLDFAINLRLTRVPTSHQLAAGTLSARDRYPTSGSVLVDTEWRESTVAPVIEWRTVDPRDADLGAARFIDLPWDLEKTPPVRQQMLEFSDGTGGLLVTRFHHAAADGVAACLWLQHQLATAFGLPLTVDRTGRDEWPVLREHGSPRRRSAFAFGSPADRLQGAAGEPTARRAWRTVRLASDAWSEVARAHDVTYNAFLSTVLLETARQWNARDGAGTPAVGLWIPANIRAEPARGFGNGTSRIRVYNRYGASTPFAEKCRAVRAQMEWSQRHGEWALPAWSTRPRRWSPIGRRLLRAYLERPWADMGTLAFSHLRRTALDDLEPGLVASTAVIGSLDRRHPLGVFAATGAGETTLSFVHDPGQLDDMSVRGLIEVFEAQLDAARREVGA
jgi:hypothetical protein